MRNRFRQAISLGTTCQTAFQIRRQLGRFARSSGVFDGQITPLQTVITYFERDFRGLFEFEDLRTRDDGSVVNKRFHTQHPHEFPLGLDNSYAEARSRHDYLCAKLRDVLDGNVPTLFLVSRSPNEPDVVDSVRQLIRRRNAMLRFDVVEIVRRAEPTRPDYFWQGNDAEWKEALSPYEISPPRYFRRQVQRFLGHINFLSQSRFRD